MEMTPDARSLGMFVACVAIGVVVFVGIILIVCIAGLLVQIGEAYYAKKTR